MSTHILLLCMYLPIYLYMCPPVSFCCACAHPYAVVYVPTHILVSVSALVYVPMCILLLCMFLSIYLCMCLRVSFCCVRVRPYSAVFYVLSRLISTSSLITISDCSISVIKSCLYHGSYFLCCLFLNVFTSFIVFILISVPYVKRKLICSVVDRSSEWFSHEVTW